MSRRLILIAILLLLSPCAFALAEKQGTNQLSTSHQLTRAPWIFERVPLGTVNATPPAAQTSGEAGGRIRYLVGNLQDVRATITTDAGDQQTSFSGEVAFQVSEKDGSLSFLLKRLNLLSPGVPTMKGESGTIGLNLKGEDSTVKYDPQTGRLNGELKTALHYELIDEVMGYIPGKSEDCAVFDSYTEEMDGKLEGSLPASLRAMDEGNARMSAQVQLELATPTVIGSIRNTIVRLDLSLVWLLTEPAEVLKVQPVFLGTGPEDPTATGAVFNTLITRALETWKKCGTTRCITLLANSPIYIDNDDYRILSGPDEAVTFKGEVNIPDAVEVFVAERWDPLYDGGGACWSSGTASAKIVTCDQQLSVPCPPPCGGGSCGDVNYYHLGHELGHAMNLKHPGEGDGVRPEGSITSIMEPSGFCADNPNIQSAHNCRSASNPIMYWGRSICTGTPEILD